MPVTELAILPLTYVLTSSNPTLPTSIIEKFRTAKAALEHASGYTFLYFQQIEDPTIIYIIGKWESAAAHREFLPLKENLALLELFKDDIVMQGEEGRKMAMWHLDADIFGLKPTRMGEKSVLRAPVISCNRYFIPANKKDDFVKKFSEVKGLLEDYTTPYPVMGGWRIEKESIEGKERDEWVQISGFENVDHHMGFAKTEEFAKYREVVGLVEGFEVKHLKAIEGL
ncbi:dimeric alpha-beta barrel protein [Rutstroemia sp. NJR-2017a BVV2]|nr:dimeric alpha-beta barrel protein [Rutstroemia sp. NJR-2017a BVV2]